MYVSSVDRVYSISIYPWSFHDSDPTKFTKIIKLRVDHPILS